LGFSKRIAGAEYNPVPLLPNKQERRMGHCRKKLMQEIDAQENKLMQTQIDSLILDVCPLDWMKLCT
jgi:hypothetical protein